MPRSLRALQVQQSDPDCVLVACCGFDLGSRNSGYDSR